MKASSSGVKKVAGGDGRGKQQQQQSKKSTGGKQLFSSSFGKATTTISLKEKQGPIDWSIYGLKAKYRGEQQREDLWNLWLSANNYAKTRMLTRIKVEEAPMVIPVAKIERHPFFVQFFEKVQEENDVCLSRSKARLLMKRFVFDVQELWLSNLQSIREHDPANQFLMNTSDEDAHRRKNIYNTETNEDRQTQREKENYMRGNGLKSRRDTKAIESIHESQIQSVSLKRSLERAYHTARIPETKVVLDYQSPYVAAKQKIDKLLFKPPTIEPLLSEIKVYPAFSQAPPYLMRKVVMHVDRIIPCPSEYYYLLLQPEILWRFAVFQGSGTTIRNYYVCKEADVAAYVASILLRRTSDSSTHSNESIPLAKCVSSHDVYTAMSTPSRQLSLPWSSYPALTHLPIKRFLISVLGYSAVAEDSDSTAESNQLRSIKIEICAELESESAHNEAEASSSTGAQASFIFVEVSSAEVQHTLDMRWAPIVDYGDGKGIEWWTHADRASDVWPRLLGELQVQGQLSDADGDSEELQSQPYGDDNPPVPALLTLRSQRNYADRVEGALSSQEALSCAYELLDLIQIEEMGSVRQDGAEIFIPSEYRVNLLEPESDDASQGGSIAPVFLSTEDLEDYNDDDPFGEADRDSIGVAKLLREGLWEEIVYSMNNLRSKMLKGFNLSMIASGAIDSVSVVPGACAYGKRGIWFDDHVTGKGSQSDKPTGGLEVKEYTQVSAHFFRDSRLSSSDSVLINMTHALETAMMFPSSTAWEAFSTYPSSNPAEEVLPVIPFFCSWPTALMARSLDSPISSRMAQTVMVFCTIPVEGEDYIPLDAPTKPDGFQRHVPIKNLHGFREKVELPLLGVDPVLATQVFGITRLGAVANSMNVNTRNIWHNIIAITEHINRPRAPRDYHYILANIKTSGANDPVSYTTRMKASECVGLRSSAFKEYEDNYASIKEMRDIFNKQLVLDAKIERVEQNLVSKLKYQKKVIQDQLQRKFEKSLKKATKSEIGWRSRFKMSTLVEIQDNWEKRRDDRSGAFFFHQILPSSLMFQPNTGRRAADFTNGGALDKERYMESCQWEIPATWDGDPLSTDLRGATAAGSSFGPGNSSTVERSGSNVFSSIESTGLDNASISTGSKHGAIPSALDAFDEPPDSWAPPVTSRPSNMQMTSTGQLQLVRHDNNSDSAKHTVASLKSVSESSAATIDTVNLEHIAEQLVSSDELMRVIARRLGLSENMVIPVDELSSVFSADRKPKGGGPGAGNRGRDDDPNVGADGLDAPRDDWLEDLHDPEFDSDDDAMWSDEDDEVGDFDIDENWGDPDTMPENPQEATELKKKMYREGKPVAQSTVPGKIPHLDIGAASGEQGEGAVGDAFSWRRLPRPNIGAGFMANANQTYTQGPDTGSSNTLNTPLFLVPISPVDACKYEPIRFALEMESIFIPNAKRDMERSIATLERNIRREKELLKSIPTDDLLLFGEAAEFTSVDNLVAKQLKADKMQIGDPQEHAKEQALLAAKATNIAQMEDALAEDIPINTSDIFGNTLLILAAQQGSKRMCKFLLRRGANINAQTLVGNSALHYCYAYSQHALGDYLKTKGADDAILNVDGLTCYEGLSKDSMKEMYGDEDSEEEEEEEEDDDDEY